MMNNINIRPCNVFYELYIALIFMFNFQINRLMNTYLY